MRNNSPTNSFPQDTSPSPEEMEASCYAIADALASSTPSLPDYQQALEELAALDISIGNNEEAKDIALIDAINHMTQQSFKNGDDVMQMGHELVKEAFVDLMLKHAFTKFKRPYRF